MFHQCQNDSKQTFGCACNICMVETSQMHNRNLGNLIHNTICHRICGEYEWKWCYNFKNWKVQMELSFLAQCDLTKWTPNTGWMQRGNQTNWYGWDEEWRKKRTESSSRLFNTSISFAVFFFSLQFDASVTHVTLFCAPYLIGEWMCVCVCTMLFRIYFCGSGTGWNKWWVRVMCICQRTSEQSKIVLLCRWHFLCE